MIMKGFRSLIALLLAAAVCSCSTTRVLEQGQYRLARNEIKIVGGDGKLNSSQLSPYVRQQPNSYFIFGWNPFLHIYNWSDGSDRLFSRLARTIGEAPVVYDADLVELSLENIERRMETLGYYNSEVRSEVSVHRRLASVSYIVKPGTRFVVDSITFHLPDNEEFKEEFFADSSNMIVHPGDFLSEDILGQESARSASHFRKKGYFELNKNLYSFVADTISIKGKTILEYHIGDDDNDERIRKYRIGDVKISHSSEIPFRSSVLKSLNTIRPGELYNEQTVNNTYSRMSSLKVFSSVGVEMSKRGAGSDLVDCNIKLTESMTKGFKANLEMSTNSTGLFGISPQLSFYNKNIFHGGEWFKTSLVGNFQFRPSDNVHSNEFGASAGLSLPKFLGLPYKAFKGPVIPRTEFNASFNFQSRPEYTRNIFSFSFGYSGTHKERLSYQFYPLQMNFVRLFDLDPAFSKTLEGNPFMKYAYQDHFDTGAGGTVYYATNTDIVPKTSFSFARFTFDLSGNVISLFNDVLRRNADGTALIWGAPYTQYVRAELNLGRTYRFGSDDGDAIATRVLLGAGYAYGNSTAIPFEKQFYSGGANSLRGWQARSVGPGAAPMNNSFSIPSQTGDLKFEANLEYRFNMFWKMEGAFFAECGNVWTLGSDTPQSNFAFDRFFETLAADWGLGLRINLDFILLRLDLGIKVYDPSKSAETRWIGPSEWLKSDNMALHFGVGYPF